MRSIRFAGNSDRRFKLVYFAFVQGGNNLSTGKKDRAVVRLEARIQNKFEELSTVDDEDPDIPRKLKSGKLILSLTEEEYQLIDKYIDAVAWPTSQAIQVSDMLDLWGSASRVESPTQADS